MGTTKGSKVIYNNYSSHHREWVIIYAPDDLKQPLHDVHTELDKLMGESLSSDDPTVFVDRIFKLQKHRVDLLDRVYANSSEASNHGRLMESISLKIISDFLAIAGKRINAKEAIASASEVKIKQPRTDRVGEITHNGSVRIMNNVGQEVIVFDGYGRIIEYHYGKNSELEMTCYYEDKTEDMSHKDYKEEGFYEGPLQWITQSRVYRGKRQSRAFTGFGTLNYDWRK